MEKLSLENLINADYQIKKLAFNIPYYPLNRNKKLKLQKLENLIIEIQDLINKK